VAIAATLAASFLALFLLEEKPLADAPTRSRLEKVVSSLRTKRGNPGDTGSELDCFVAVAPRNDEPS